VHPNREVPTETLTQLRNRLDVKAEMTTTPLEDFKLKLLDAEPTISFGKGRARQEFPAHLNSIVALGNILNVPSPFLKKQENDVRQTLLEMLIAKHPGEVLVRFNEGELLEVQKPTALMIDPRRLVDAAMHVIDPKAIVVEAWQEPGIEFRCDVIVPEGFDRGIGGVKPRKGTKQVGDITRGGIRFGVEHKRHLAPWVSQYLYRLVCTNGMERQDAGWKVDARGMTVEDVLKEFELQADRAFKGVEHAIRAHYDLRSQPVDNPERTLLRVGREQKLPDRVTMRLVEEAASSDLPDEPTMFDIVNLITNQGNDPDIADRPDVRRVFESCGGIIVADHAARCGHCMAKLN
jgi:hypothetical protein